MEHLLKVMGSGYQESKATTSSSMTNMRAYKRDFRVSGEGRKRMDERKSADNLVHVSFYKYFDDDFNDNEI